MPVAYCELPGSPKFGYSQDGRMTCTRNLSLLWADVHAFMLEMLPPSEYIGAQVQQYLGSPCPYILRSDSLPSMWAESVEINPFFDQAQAFTGTGTGGTLSSPVTYGEARATVTYEVPEYQVDNTGTIGDAYFADVSLLFDPMPYLVHRITSGGQLLSVAAPDYWEWGTTNVAVREGVSIPLMVSTSQHSCTWLRVPTFDTVTGDYSAFLSLLNKWEQFKGRVNDRTMFLGNREYPAETLLYLNYDQQQLVMTNGQTAVDVTFHYESNQKFDESGNFVGGYNHYWDDTTGAWDRVQKIGDSDRRPYRQEYLQQMFVL